MSDNLDYYEGNCFPEQLTFDYDSPVELLSDTPLSSLGRDLGCDGVSVEEGLNLLDQVQCTASLTSLPSPVSDCSWDSGNPGSSTSTTDAHFFATFFGAEISPRSPTPVPSPTDCSVYSRSPVPSVEARSRREFKDFDELDHSRSRGGKVSESMAQRNRRNAEAARQNRLKKKKYVEDLEGDRTSLKTENVILKAKCHEFQTRCQRLQSEVTYLKAVLANDSVLASLLQNIPNMPKLKLASSFCKRPAPSNPDGQPPARKKQKRPETTTGGVCLHVARDSVSLELCDSCSRKAASP